MSIGAEPIIYGLIFVGVLVLVEGLYLTGFGRSISLDKRVNRRLELLEKHGNREQVMETLRKEMEQHLKARRVPLYAILSVKAQKAAIAFTPKQIVMIMAATGVQLKVADGARDTDIKRYSIPIDTATTASSASPTAVAATSLVLSLLSCFGVAL